MKNLLIISAVILLLSSCAKSTNPAPLAATQGGALVYVARVRPTDAKPGTPLLLELGHLDANGAFVADTVVPARHGARDVSLLVDDSGSVWLSYGDAAKTTLERYSCK